MLIGFAKISNASHPVVKECASAVETWKNSANKEATVQETHKILCDAAQNTDLGEVYQIYALDKEVTQVCDKVKMKQSKFFKIF